MDKWYEGTDHEQIIYFLSGINEALDDIAASLMKLAMKGVEECSHEWHADKDNDCNFCIKCGARQEIYHPHVDYEDGREYP